MNVAAGQVKSTRTAVEKTDKLVINIKELFNLLYTIEQIFICSIVTIKDIYLNPFKVGHFVSFSEKVSLSKPPTSSIGQSILSSGSFQIRPPSSPG